MSLRLKTAWVQLSLVVAVSMFAQTQPQTIEVLKTWRGSSPADLVARADFGAMPYELRRQVLAQVDAGFGALHRWKQHAMLWDIEKTLAEQKKYVPLDFFVWDREDRRNCLSIYKEGEEILVTVVTGLIVATRIYDESNYTVAWVHVANREGSRDRVDVFPENFVLATVAPRPQIRPVQDPNQMARSTTRKSRLWAALIAGLAATAQTTTYTQESGQLQGDFRLPTLSGTYSGSYTGTRTTTGPDYEARRQGQQTARGIVQRAEDEAERVSSGALRATTLYPGQKASGFVYFKRDKSARSSVLGLPIAGVAFEFPVVWRRK